MNAGAITAEFVDSTRGRILAVAHHPTEFEGRCVLVVPPFAEEMNKSRRMIAELAQRLTRRRIGLVVPDYFGTGDSEGEFSATDCDTWLEDLAATEQWMRRKNWSIDALLGIRLGCIVAADFARRSTSAFEQIIFWQPTLDGGRVLEQFLRLRVAATLMEDKKETVAELKAKSAAGEVVEVAGYELSPRLVAQLSRLQLQTGPVELPGAPRAIHWIEVLRSADASVPIPTVKAIEQLKTTSQDVRLHTVIGEPFWASAEIVCLPELLDTTANLVAGQPA